jgi:hypothetical protein
MALVKYNDNSISAISSAGQLAQGSLVPIKTLTASGSASLSFVDGSNDVVLDSTYPIYKFEFINIHPATDNVSFSFNLSTDGGSNYNVTKTTTYFYAYLGENGSYGILEYVAGLDLAQSTSDQPLSNNVGNDNDQSASGELFLFNPSSTTFVKHFMSTTNQYDRADISVNPRMAGYGNTTSSINAVRFQMSSGNIDAGKIKLYGIKDS